MEFSARRANGRKKHRRRAQSRRLGLAGLLLALVVLNACGAGSGPHISAGQNTSVPSSSMTTTSPSSGTAPTSSTSAPSPSPTTVQAGFSVVHYQSVTFQVPSNWPVYDLAQDPTRCVRYDVHAVYLGHEGSTPNCPAHLVGRTDTVRVEPLDASSEPQAAQATQSATISGQPVHVDPSGATSGTLVVSFDSLGVIATLTFRADDLLDQQILQTFTQAM